MSVIEDACVPELVKRKFVVPLAPSESVSLSCVSPMPQLPPELAVMQSNEKVIAACAANAAAERSAPTMIRALCFTKPPHLLFQHPTPAPGESTCPRDPISYKRSAGLCPVVGFFYSRISLQPATRP